MYVHGKLFLKIRSMKEKNKPKISMKEKLSLLWIFVMFNYIYCDILGLMDANILKQFLTGSVDGMEITQGFLFAGAILMEIPIVMILLSRFLKYKANRIANIIAGSIKTVAMLLTMFVGTPTLYYLFFGSIEIACTSYIIWLAWNWKKSPEPILPNQDAAG